jgi:putative FmdB family regulatory protein
MPIFDFKCEACGCAKELLRKISDPIVTLCPMCHKETFKKQVSAPSFQLTGSGWYVTDFKNKSKSDVKSDQIKPDTKTETKKDANASSTSN